MAASAATVALFVWLASGRHAEEVTVLHQTVDLFAFTHGSMAFHDELSWLPLCVGVLTLASILVGGWLFFRPLRLPCTLPDQDARDAARELVRLHGTIDDLHQGALARTVLAQNGVDLARGDRQIDAGVRHDRRVALGNVAQFQSLGHDSLLS